MLKQFIMILFVIAFASSAQAKESVSPGAGVILEWNNSSGDTGTPKVHGLSGPNGMTIQRYLGRNSSITIKIYLRRGDSLYFHAKPARSADLDMYLWNDFRLVDADRSTNNNASIRHRARKSGVYHLVIHNYSGPATSFSLTGRIN